MELPGREICYRALQSRDARFDGLIFVGVLSTGIYCRPVCPASTARLSQCQFFSSAAAAQQAGFRPCLRCRPETAPHPVSWKGSSNTISRALSLIQEGALDEQGLTVADLAAHLGLGDRQLRRLFLQHLGASPIAVAQTRRILFAKQLLHETTLPMGQIAIASGYGSVRRFNECFQTLFQRPPSALRKAMQNEVEVAQTGVTLRLRYYPPYDWNSILNFLAARSIPGMESVSRGRYRRTVAIGKFSGSIEVSHLAQKNSLELKIFFPRVKELSQLVQRARRVFDIGVYIETITEHLSQDPFLKGSLSVRPGLRAPGGWDGYELAVRAILGQQITVAGARTLAGKLVEAHGKPVSRAFCPFPELTHVFPEAASIATIKDIELGMPESRRRTLQALALAATADANLFRTGKNMQETIDRLRSIPGIGEWTAHYIALRALRETDAFPATDIGLLRGMAKLLGRSVTAKELVSYAEAWRPWRAYAAQHLWAIDAEKETL